MTREEAIAVLRREIEPSVYEDEKSIAEAIDMAIEALSADTVPIEKYHELQHQFVMLGATFADLTEVVRCKDCKWYKKIVEKSKSGLCHYDLVARCLHDDDYCSHGELAEQTEYKMPGYDEIMEKLDKLTLKGGDQK